MCLSDMLLLIIRLYYQPQIYMTEKKKSKRYRGPGHATDCVKELGGSIGSKNFVSNTTGQIP